MKKKRIVKLTLLLFLIVSISLVGLYYSGYFDSAAIVDKIIPRKQYTAAYFGIETLKSDVDYNKNGIDDYTDILIGARKYKDTNPVYDSTYYVGGYPPAGIGVCTDVIWASLKNAGYNLKEMFDQDVLDNLDYYTTIGYVDPNIDFRRVDNLELFFDHKIISLTLDPSAVAEWQPGDMVVYPGHIGIISDIRNKDGHPYVIHHAGGKPVLEEDSLTSREITGHYRFKLVK